MILKKEKLRKTCYNSLQLKKNKESKIFNNLSTFIFEEKSWSGSAGLSPRHMVSYRGSAPSSRYYSV